MVSQHCQQMAKLCPCVLQSAKSAALGPRRQTEALSEVLAEPMLTRFQAEAAKAEETGWFWKYKCSSVKVHVHYWTRVKGATVNCSRRRNLNAGSNCCKLNKLMAIMCCFPGGVLR